MAYFRHLSEITYNNIKVKNIFKKYILNEDVLQNEIVFYRYTLKPGELLIDVAESVYGDKFFDWIIKLTNNIKFTEEVTCLTRSQIESQIRKLGKSLNSTHHIETIESDFYEEGLIVDESFLSKDHQKNINGKVITQSGENLAIRVSYLDYYEDQNEKKSLIYILKPSYFRDFLEAFRQYMDT